MRCIVKIIVNPAVEKSFTLTFATQVELKIMIHNAAEILEMTEFIEKNLATRYNFQVQFSWKNVPLVIQNNMIFRERMLKLLQSGLVESDIVDGALQDYTQNIEKLVQIARLHVQNYGCNPNFANTATDKNKSKIHNYLASHLAMPNLSMNTALAIAKHLSTPQS